MLKEKVYFPNLDGLRFIAATMVFLQHGFSRFAVATGIQTDWITRVVKTFGSGGLGVSVFFVLSGFLITYLLLEEKKITGKISLKNFYIRRVLRIWPLYFFVVVFGFIIYPGLKHLIGMETHLCSRAAYYWTFLSNFDEIYIHHNCYGSGAQMQSITWSVSIEEQFYLIWPLLFIVVNPRFYKYIFISIITLSIAFRLFNYDDDPVLYFHTFSVLVDLACGGLAAWAMLNTTRLRNWLESLTVVKSSLIYIIGFAGLMYWDKFEVNPFCHALVRIYFASYFVFIILHQNYAPDSFLKLSHNRIFTSMGKYTYGMYLLHPLAILLMDIILRLAKVQRDTLFSEGLFGISAFIITIIISLSSYHLFEKRFLRLKSRFSIIRTD
ncbi:MAG: acyltransferase [Bacteroidota bacterium]